MSILCCPHFSVLTVRKRGRLSDWPSSAPAHICPVSPRYMMVTGYLCPAQLQIFCKVCKYFHMSSTWQRREPGCGDRWQCITCHVSRVTWRVSPVSGPARDWAGTGVERVAELGPTPDTPSCKRIIGDVFTITVHGEGPYSGTPSQMS